MSSMSREGTRFDDSLWTRVATADVEDEVKFYECAMNMKQEAVIYFGAYEYEGVGEDSSRGTYSFTDGVLRDSGGDIIEARNVVMGAEFDYLSSESSEECTPSAVGARGRGRGARRGRGRGRGARERIYLNGTYHVSPTSAACSFGRLTSIATSLIEACRA